MSDKTDAQTPDPNAETVEGFVVKVPRFNPKTIKIIAVSFTAGAAVAALVMEVMHGALDHEPETDMVVESQESVALDTQD